MDNTEAAHTIFDDVSPLDTRYRCDDLADRCLSTEADIHYQALVELAVVRVLSRRGLCPPGVYDEVKPAVGLLTAAEVDGEEKRIQHNVQALVNCLKRKVSDGAKPYIHGFQTSFDILSTAENWRLRDAIQLFVLPELVQLEKLLVNIARREAATLQMGRTHGQHAIPITFGFALAEYVSRLGERITKLNLVAKGAPGKVSGPVGAYNAACLVLDDPVCFEAEVLAEVGLRQLEHSTQIVQPEWLTDMIHLVISTFGVLAGLADDMRHLQRTEISEVGEAFDAEQAGSSAMPHKRNPWNFENVKSMWKEFMPRMNTVYMDQLSEHQRDLTNSASARFVPEVIVAICSSARRLNRVMAKFTTDQERMRSNLHMQGDMAMSEAIKVVLAQVGHPQAHEAVRLLTLEAQNCNPPQLLQLFWSDPDLEQYRALMTPVQVEQLSDLEMYIGLSVQRTQEVCDNWEAAMGGLESELGRIARLTTA